MSLKKKFSEVKTQVLWDEGTVTLTPSFLGLALSSLSLSLAQSLSALSLPSLLPCALASSHARLSRGMKFKFECMPWRLNYARSVIRGGVSFLNVTV